MNFNYFPSDENPDSLALLSSSQELSQRGNPNLDSQPIAVTSQEQENYYQGQTSQRQGLSKRLVQQTHHNNLNGFTFQPSLFKSGSQSIILKTVNNQKHLVNGQEEGVRIQDDSRSKRENQGFSFQRPQLVRPETHHASRISMLDLKLGTQHGQEQRNVITAGNSRLSMKKSFTQSKLISVDNNSLLNPYQLMGTNQPLVHLQHGQIEKSLTKEEKLSLLKQRKTEKEFKIKNALEIYSSVRPQHNVKDTQRVQSQYYETMQKQSRVVSIEYQSTVAQIQSSGLRTPAYSIPPHSAGAMNPTRQLEMTAQLPQSVMSQHQKLWPRGETAGNASNSTKEKTSISLSPQRYLNSKIMRDFDTEINTTTHYNQKNSGLNTSKNNNISMYLAESKIYQGKSYISRGSLQKSNHFKANSMISQIRQLEQAIKKQKQVLDNDLDMKHSEQEEQIDDLLFQDKSFVSTVGKSRIDKNEETLLKSFVMKHIINSDAQGLAKELESIMSQAHRRQAVNLRDQNNGRTALFYAVSLKNHEICEILLRNGAETQLRDKIGRTVLHYVAIKGCDKNLLEMILSYQKQERQSMVESSRAADIFKGKLFDLSGQMQQKLLQSPYSKSKFLHQTHRIQTPSTGRRMLNLKNQNNGVADEEKDNNRSISIIQQTHQSFANETMTFQTTGNNNLTIASAKNSFQGDQAQNNLEIVLKRSAHYKNSLNQFINLTDNFGKTPLHYASQRDNENLVKVLVNAGANVFIRDIKNQKPIDLTKNQEIQTLLQKAEKKFEEESKRKVVAVKVSQNASNLTGILKQKLSLKQLELSSIEVLAQYSNQQLSQFIYGLHGDNALTYMMRIDDREKFEYILGRGVLPSASDEKGHNSLFYAVRMERLHYVSFLLEAEYHSLQSDHEVTLNIDFINKKQNQGLAFNKSYMQSTFSQMGKALLIPQESKLSKSNFQIDSLLSLDKSSSIDGSTLFHECAKTGSSQILAYLIKVMKVRNTLIEEQSLMTKNQSFSLSISDKKSLKDILDFTDSDNLTPLLIAAKFENLGVMKLLVSEGANLYCQCSLLQNVLHYAVSNGSEEMIKYLVQADAESMILKNEVNYKNQKPEHLDIEKKYYSVFNHIWEAAFTKSQQSHERLQQILKSEKQIYNATSQTIIGLNTPLHFAIMSYNLKALRMLVQSTDQKQDLETPNADGITPKQLASLYKNGKDANRILNILNRKYINQGATMNGTSSAKKKKAMNLKIQQFSKVDYEDLGQSPLVQPFYESPSKFELYQAAAEQSQPIDISIQNLYSEKEAKIKTNPITSKTQSFLMPSQRDQISVDRVKHHSHLQQMQSEAAIDQQSIYSSGRSTQDQAKDKEQETEDQNQSPLKHKDAKQFEKFIQQKQNEYVDENRLGRFNPVIYDKILTGHADYTNYHENSSQKDSPTQSQADKASISQSQPQKLSLKKSKSTVKRKAMIEQLFEQIDIRKMLFIDLNQIQDNWQLFETLIDEGEQKRLKMYLDRYYRETKITLPSFLKIMNFYLIDV